MKVNTDEEAASWQFWCRLCAKDALEKKIPIFPAGEEHNTTIATAIGKYFWVNIRSKDELPTTLCLECHTLLTSLSTFTERVNKVQAMFCMLQNSKSNELLDLNEVRSQYGLLDEEHEHLIKCKSVYADEKKEMQQNESAEQIELEDELEDEVCNVEMAEEFEERTFSTSEHEFVTDNESAIINFELERNSDTDGDEEIHFKYIKTKTAHRKQNVDETADDERGFEVENTAIKEDKDFQSIFEKNATQKIRNAVQPEGDVSICASDMEACEKEVAESLVVECVDENSVSGVNESEKFQYEKFHYTNDDNRSIKDEADTEKNESNEVNEAAEGTADNSQQQQQKNNASTTLKRKRGRPPKAYNIELIKLCKTAAEEDETALEEVIEAKYKCTFCSKIYKNLTCYRKHVTDAHNAAPDIAEYSCHVCEKTFPSERQLTTHERNHLPLEEKANVPCPYCDKKFTKMSVLKQHIVGFHRNEKRFICDECGRGLKSLAALNEHKLVHTTECPFKCEVCGKGFKNKPRLKVHAETHTDTNYVCTLCGMQLNTRRTLTMHMLVHSDHRRYKCDFCGAGFKRTKALKNHLILHTGLRPYKCSFCPRTFSNGSNCRSHKRKTHPRELADEEARGIKTEPTTVPKLEELRACQEIKNPGNMKRQSGGGLSLEMRNLLIAAEKHSKATNEQLDEVTLEAADNASNAAVKLEDSDNAENADASGEETIIYEFIDEI